MDIIEIILFMLPAYIANSAPVLLSGWGPLDRKALFGDGNRILGDSKTIRGTLGGIVAGILVGAILSYNISIYLLSPLGTPDFGFDDKMLISSLMVLGAILGDLLGSFIKRRLEIKPGEPFLLTDQLLFILMAIAFSTIPKGFFISLYDLGAVLIITLFLHFAANIIAHRLNLKKVPW
ncbi:MAG: CDP-2,3-bis-(O-geranylgeranyl)-sn-glycerol synthase [Candidatus Micrarchaeota archaeon]